MLRSFNSITTSHVDDFCLPFLVDCTSVDIFYLFYFIFYSVHYITRVLILSRPVWPLSKGNWCCLHLKMRNFFSCIYCHITKFSILHANVCGEVGCCVHVHACVLLLGRHVVMSMWIIMHWTLHSAVMCWNLKATLSMLRLALHTHASVSLWYVNFPFVRLVSWQFIDEVDEVLPKPIDPHTVLLCSVRRLCYNAWCSFLRKWQAFIL